MRKISLPFLLALSSGLAPMVGAQAPTPSPFSRAAPAPFEFQRPMEKLTPRPTGSTPAQAPKEHSPMLPPQSSPFGVKGPPSSSPNPEPPRDGPLVEMKFDQLSNRDLSKNGSAALRINPTKWKHAETENFILHYRRTTEAQKVAREVEYDLWYVAGVLGAGPDRYQRKSDVYIFEDDSEWKKFLLLSGSSMKWAVSFAYGDELYLNVRGGGNSGPGTSFDSHTLAHEATHAVVSRLYPEKRWPIWLNEGFAEYMGGATVAARKGQYSKRFERNLDSASLSLEQLTAITQYPKDPESIHQLYQSSEKFVRYLMTELPKERITSFIDAILAGKPMPEAMQEVYGDKIGDWDSFLKKYDRFAK